MCLFVFAARVLGMLDAYLLMRRHKSCREMLSCALYGFSLLNEGRIPFTCAFIALNNVFLCTGRIVLLRPGYRLSSHVASHYLYIFLWKFGTLRWTEKVYWNKGLEKDEIREELHFSKQERHAQFFVFCTGDERALCLYTSLDGGFVKSLWIPFVRCTAVVSSTSFHVAAVLSIQVKMSLLWHCVRFF